MDAKLMNTYSRLPVTFSRGEAAYLWDNQGRSYLDAICGIAVTGLGHAHADITRAICEQAGQLIHTSNLFEIEYQTKLAQRLCEISGMQRAFFSNSGAEANEAAIKLARLYGKLRGIKTPEIIVMERSFHGRTLATLSATGNRKVQAGFEPLVQGFVRAPYNDLEAIEVIAKHNKNVVAVLLEPIQGEGGIIMPDPDYLPGVREICDKNNWLMILDEIQTGMGRSGQWFAFQHYHFQPDIMTLAKSLANGVPIGACLAAESAQDIFKPGNHGSTFGGNPLACRTALEVINTIDKDDLITRAQLLGERILQGLKTTLQEDERVSDIRGKGLLLAIELNTNCTALAKNALDLGLLINVTAERVIRILPPLILTDSEADILVEKLTQLVTSFSPAT